MLNVSEKIIELAQQSLNLAVYVALILYNVIRNLECEWVQNTSF